MGNIGDWLLVLYVKFFIKFLVLAPFGFMGYEIVISYTGQRHTKRDKMQIRATGAIIIMATG